MSTSLISPTALALPPLYETEGSLLALLETEGIVAPEQEEQFKLELAEQLTKTVAKRDRTGGFLKQLAHAATACGEEIKRLQTYKRVLENTEERVRGYVVSVIEGLGSDDKGRLRKLQGTHFTLSARACPASVKIADEASIPVAYKRVRVDMPAEQWEAAAKILAQHTPLVPAATYYTDGAKLKDALEEGKDVAGAELIVGRNTLQIR